ncbi:MAG: AAA family ATPase [Rhodospirillales bacterium]|nr:AAA family ATPase [Rhodospirillales bacterium]
MRETQAEPEAGPPARRAGILALARPGALDPAPPNWRGLIAALRRRIAVFLACVLAIPTLAALALHRTTPLYTATGTLIYEPNAFKPRELQSILRHDRITEAVMASQAQMLAGLRLIEPMAERLHLFADPEFNAALRPPGHVARLLAWALSRLARAPPATRPAPPGPGLDPGRDQTLLAIQRAVGVRIVDASRVLSVSFTAADPVMAAAAVNTLMDIYIKGQLGAKYRAVRKARVWLEGRAATLRRQVAAQSDRIARFRARAGLVRGVRAGLETEQISHLTATLAEARAALAAAEGRLDAARGGEGAAAIAPSVIALRRRRDDMAAGLQSLLTRLGPNHPEVLALRRQLAATDAAVGAETARVTAATAAAVAAARHRVAGLEADLGRARATIDAQAGAEIRLRAMRRDADVSRALLVSVLQRLQEISQQAAVEVPDAHEVSLALPPAAPSFPRTLPLLLAAAGFGLGFGLFAVWLVEIADTTLPGGDAVRAALARPCLALVPEVRRAVLGRLRVEDYAALKPRSAFAEQLRALRAGLWLGAARPRAVAVTAARPAEGKTTVAVALGRAAALSGERTILLDCDLRHPALARLFGTEGAPGLADYLREEADLSEVVRKDPLTSLRYVGAGRPDADGFGLFLSDAMADLMQRLREEYDLVLLDTPPALAMSDTRVIASLADATVLCARWRRTPREVAQAAIALLEDARAEVAGVALTRVDPREHARSGSADASMVDPRANRYLTE